MTTFISILRGINVSGQKLIKMDALKKMYESLRFENVRTYVQSGNVVFSSEEKDVRKIETIISSRIKKDFGFEVPVIVLTAGTLETIVKNNPLIKDKEKDIAFLHVTFLEDTPSHLNKEAIIGKKQANEEIFFSSNAVYLYCPNGYGVTKLNNNFLEKKLEVKATTRNWKTTTELLKLATRQ